MILHLIFLLYEIRLNYISFAGDNIRAALLRFIQTLRGMVKFILICKASHGKKRGNKMSNWVTDLTLNIIQNCIYNMHIKNGCFKCLIFKILHPSFFGQKNLSIQISENKHRIQSNGIYTNTNSLHKNFKQSIKVSKSLKHKVLKCLGLSNCTTEPGVTRSLFGRVQIRNSSFWHRFFGYLFRRVRIDAARSRCSGCCFFLFPNLFWELRLYVVLTPDLYEE